ncbi:MAG: hypothetical protein LBR15_11095 [Methanobrevibacter sp.]|nr:hypothetical protein [Candidatus Methanovirga australis]
MNLNKIFGLAIMTMFMFSVVVLADNVNAANPNERTFKVDGSPEFIHHFRFEHINGDTIWKCNVAAGDSHSKTLDISEFKMHQIVIKVDVDGIIKNKHKVALINIYQPSDITLFSEEKYVGWRKCSFLHWEYNGKSGVIEGASGYIG